MPATILDAILAHVDHFLARVGTFLTVLDSHVRHTIQQTLHALATAASLLLSFESLVIASLLTFVFLGGALTVLVLWPILTERDDYDECERGLYYADDDEDGRWVAMAVPVILVDRDGQIRINGNDSVLGARSSAQIAHYDHETTTMQTTPADRGIEGRIAKNSLTDAQTHTHPLTLLPNTTTTPARSFIHSLNITLFTMIHNTPKPVEEENKDLLGLREPSKQKENLTPLSTPVHHFPLQTGIHGETWIASNAPFVDDLQLHTTTSFHILGSLAAPSRDAVDAEFASFFDFGAFPAPSARISGGFDCCQWDGKNSTDDSQDFPSSPELMDRSSWADQNADILSLLQAQESLSDAGFAWFDSDVQLEIPSDSYGAALLTSHEPFENSGKNILTPVAVDGPFNTPHKTSSWQSSPSDTLDPLAMDWIFSSFPSPGVSLDDGSSPSQNSYFSRDCSTPVTSPGGSSCTAASPSTRTRPIVAVDLMNIDAQAPSTPVGSYSLFDSETSASTSNPRRCSSTIRRSPSGTPAPTQTSTSPRCVPPLGIDIQGEVSSVRPHHARGVCNWEGCNTLIGVGVEEVAAHMTDAHGINVGVGRWPKTHPRACRWPSCAARGKPLKGYLLQHIRSATG
ncbi:hypothetical protein B0H19DRAFT_1371523 [Mycena capillaripes]|nr:hypothetical protein B0H19DRAFT_1371523 [Mycena capillaripes]